MLVIIALAVIFHVVMAEEKLDLFLKIGIIMKQNIINKQIKLQVMLSD